MRVGILSMQKVRNYGSFLQAFALKRTVESFGNEVEFIDIIPGIRFHEYKITLKMCFDWVMKHYFSIYAINRWRYAVNCKKSFRLFLNELQVEKHTFNAYDCVIIGSDEVFNIAQNSAWGYTSQLFGNITDTKKIISYAGSFGQTSLELIRKHRLSEDMADALRKMSAISVRDGNSKEIIEALLHVTPSINVDPTLFFDFSKNIRENNERDYILIYSYPNRIKDKNVVKAIKQLAKRRDKKILSIGSFYEWADKVLLPHPFEFLSYFKNADYVITDTFHGVVMSVKYNRRFAALIRDTNRNKLGYLLKSLKLEGQIIGNDYDMENIVSRSIDYSGVNGIIKNETRRSLEYLRENL
jgi:polysaccharide pyruvyl transferase WcaK-like protein